MGQNYWPILTNCKRIERTSKNLVKKVNDYFNRLNKDITIVSFTIGLAMCMNVMSFICITVLQQPNK